LVGVNFEVSEFVSDCEPLPARLADGLVYPQQPGVPLPHQSSIGGVESPFENNHSAGEREDFQF